MALRAPVISIIVWKEYALLLAMFNAVRMNLCNQSSHYENFPYEWKPSRAIHTFRGEQRWMEHKGEHW